MSRFYSEIETQNFSFHSSSFLFLLRSLLQQFLPLLPLPHLPLLFHSPTVISGSAAHLRSMVHLVIICHTGCRHDRRGEGAAKPFAVPADSPKRRHPLDVCAPGRQAPPQRGQNGAPGGETSGTETLGPSGIHHVRRGARPAVVGERGRGTVYRRGGQGQA